MAAQQFAMPDLGEGLTEADLVVWTVAVGDVVELNQVIAEVETAKALVQLPSPFAGVVTRLFVEPGTTVPVGSPIIAIDVAGSAGDDPSHDRNSAAAPPAGLPARNAVLVGYGPPVEGSSRPARRARATAWRPGGPGPVGGSSAGATPFGDEARTPAAAVRAAPRTPPAERPKTFPPVRKLAQERGVDLATVPGTGPDGVITRDDVLRWAEQPTGVQAPPTPDGRVATDAPRETRTRITGVRKHTAAAMVASAFTAPHATEFLTVDVTPTMDLLAALQEDRRFAGQRITVLTMVAKAVLVALRRHPSLNSSWDEEADEIVQFGYVNLGIAAATPRGLVVPNIKDADRLDLLGLAEALTSLTEAARGGRTAPGDLAGGTISITNIGVFGIDAGTPILNPGEAAIVATGAVRRQPWEHRDQIALRSVITLSLSFDHRLVDGEQASRFLADVGTLLARPEMAVAMG